MTNIRSVVVSCLCCLTSVGLLMYDSVLTLNLQLPLINRTDSCSCCCNTVDFPVVWTHKGLSLLILTSYIDHRTMIQFDPDRDHKLKCLNVRTKRGRCKSILRDNSYRATCLIAVVLLKMISDTLAIINTAGRSV